MKFISENKLRLFIMGFIFLIMGLVMVLVIFLSPEGKTYEGSSFDYKFNHDTYVVTVDDLESEEIKYNIKDKVIYSIKGDYEYELAEFHGWNIKTDYYTYVSKGAFIINAIGICLMVEGVGILIMTFIMSIIVKKQIKKTLREMEVQEL